MDASKVKSSQPVQAAQSTKRNQDAAQNRVQTKAAAPQKSPYDTPRQTVNNQGQAIGTRINFKA